MKTLKSPRALFNIGLIFLICYLLGVRILLIFSYSVDLDGTEFAFISHILRLLNNLEVYSNPTSLPYYSCLFGPVYIYLVKWIYQLIGFDSHTSIHQLYIVGRILSFIFVIAQIALIYYYTQKRFKLKKIYFLCLLLMYLLLLSGHIFVIRPDSLKILLFILSFICLIEYEFYNSKTQLLFFFLLFSILAVFTKQDSIVFICLLIFLLAIVTKKIKYLFLLIIFYFLVALTLLYLLNIFGYAYIINTVLFNFQKVENVSTSINILFVLLSALRILPFAFITYFILRPSIQIHKNNSLFQYLLSVWVCLFIIAHIFILRAGSYINYAYESIFVLIFLLSFLFSTNQLQKLQPIIKAIAIIYFIGLFITVWLIHSYTYNFKEEKQLQQEYFANIDKMGKVKQVIGNERCFIANVKYVVYCSDFNIIGGYDYNIGRLMELYLNIEVKSHLIFFDSKEYDACFTDGTVQYIIGDKEEFIQKYYPKFKKLTQIEDLYIYQFHSD